MYHGMRRENDIGYNQKCGSWIFTDFLMKCGRFREQKGRCPC